MQFQNLHTHSTFDDRKSTLEQMVRSGMDADPPRWQNAAVSRNRGF